MAMRDSREKFVETSHLYYNDRLPYSEERLKSEQCQIIIDAYLREYPKLQRTLDEIFGKEPTVKRLGPAADEADVDDSEYTPKGGDIRQLLWRQIKARRGQSAFRDILRRRYKERCLVTGCRIVDVLEAAHIDPYRGKHNNHSRNGLLLRADIHTLFDLNLLGIEPDSLEVHLHPDIAVQYGRFVRKSLCCPKGRTPSPDALRRRYEAFLERKKSPVR